MGQVDYKEYQILPLRRVVYGEGALAAIPQILVEAGVTRIAIITTPTVSKSQLMAHIRGVCGERIVLMFTETVPHNPRTMAIRAAEAVHAAGASGIITVGGGTATDTGKAVKLILSRGIGRPEDLSPFVTSKSNIEKVALRPQSDRTALFHLAVPTTLSGAEFTHSCGMTNDATLTKHLFMYEELVPVVVILDPAATLETPPMLWVSTGVKAIDHAVEQIYARGATPVTTALCLEGLRLLHENLPLTLTKPERLDFRLQCLQGEWMAVFGGVNVMLGLSHGLGHQIGPRWHLGHGITSCVTLPHVLRFNRPYSLPQQRRMAEAISLPVAGLSDEGVAEALAQHMENFVRDMGLPFRFQEVGGRTEDFPDIAKDAINDPITVGNPRPLTSVTDVLDLLWQAWSVRE